MVGEGQVKAGSGCGSPPAARTSATRSPTWRRSPRTTVTRSPPATRSPSRRLSGGKGGGENPAVPQRALDYVWAGKLSLLIVWALGRITRDGGQGALRVIRQFRERGCSLVSARESWLNGSPEVQTCWSRSPDGWLSRTPPAGPSKDAKPYKRSGYVARWERERTAATQ